MSYVGELLQSCKTFIEYHQSCINNLPAAKTKTEVKTIVRKLYLEPVSFIFYQYLALFIYVMKVSLCLMKFCLISADLNVLTVQHVCQCLFEFIINWPSFPVQYPSAQLFLWYFDIKTW